MKIRVVLPLIVLFLAAGCAARPEFYWYRPDKTLKEARADYRQCRDKARREASEARAEEYIDRATSANRHSDSYAAPGDVHVPADRREARAAWGGVYEQNVFNGCMQARGYVQLKAHRAPASLRTESLPLGAIAGR